MQAFFVTCYISLYFPPGGRKRHETDSELVSVGSSSGSLRLTTALGLEMSGMKKSSSVSLEESQGEGRRLLFFFFTNTLPVTAGLLQAVNQTPPLASFRTAASASLLRLEMQYATYPERPGPPRKACKVTHRQASVRARIRLRRRWRGARTQTHTHCIQAKSPQDVRWMGLWHQAWGAAGISQQAAVSAVSLAGI